jgi:DNA polymerase III epsilon subunit-like protein
MYIFLDTETTGTGPDDRLCQIAFKTDKGLVVDALFNPGRPIAIEAMAVHHITNEMVADQPPFKNSPAYKKLETLLNGEQSILVAHNARFDIDMLRREGIQTDKAICTYKLSRYLDKEGRIPQYNLQYLRYHLKLDIDAVPHSALGDILVLEGLFRRIRAQFEPADEADAASQMLKISREPVLVARMPFGKHKGQKMEQIPPDYLQWLLSTDLDEDLAYTARYYLNRNA